MTDTPEYLAVDETLKCMALPALPATDRDTAAKLLQPVRPAVLQVYCNQLAALSAQQAPHPLTPMEIEQAAKNAVIAAFGGMLNAMMHQAEIMHSPDVLAFTAAGDFFKNYFAAHQNVPATPVNAPPVARQA